MKNANLRPLKVACYFSIIFIFQIEIVNAACSKIINSTKVYKFSFAELTASLPKSLIQKLEIEFVPNQLKPNTKINYYSKQTLSKLSNLELIKHIFQLKNYSPNNNSLFNLYLTKNLSFENELVTRKLTQGEICFLHQKKLLKYLVDQGFNFYNNQSLTIDMSFGLNPIDNQMKDFELLKNKSVDKTWLGIPPSVLNTSYATYIEILQNENPHRDSTFVDMGSAEGRLGFIIGSLFPRMKYIGIEYHPHRIKNSIAAAQLLDFRNVHFITSDFTSDNFTPPSGDYYYFYMPSSDAELNMIGISKLHAVAKKKKISIITTAFENPKKIIQKFSWLTYLKRVNLKSGQFPYYDLYESNLGLRKSLN